MKWGFPNRSSFGYCLLQQPLLMAGMAAEAPGISCGQGSWQQFGAASTDFVPNLCPFHPHSTSCSSATHQRSPSTQMKIISFLIFPQPQCISSSSSCPPFTADQCQQCTGKGLCDSLQTGTSLTAEHLSYVAQSTVSTSSITQAAELSCPGKWGIKATNHFWKKKRKKKKEASEMFVHLQNSGFCRNFFMHFGCSALHGLSLARHNTLLNVQPLQLLGFSKFSFSKSLCILHLSKMARNTGFCLSLNLHVIPLKSLKIFFHWYLLILLCCISN